MSDRCPPTPCICTTAPSREEAMVVLRRGIDGRPTVWCDPCIADLVAALNLGGVATVASCCGHGERDGSIALADGRWLVVCATPFDRSREISPPSSSEHKTRGLTDG